MHVLARVTAGCRPAALNAAKMSRFRQRLAGREGILRIDERIFAVGELGQGCNREPQSDRRNRPGPRTAFLVAASTSPRSSATGTGARVPALNRYDETCRLAQAAFEHPHHARAFLRIVDLGIGGIDINREDALLDHPDAQDLRRLAKHVRRPPRDARQDPAQKISASAVVAPFGSAISAIVAAVTRSACRPGASRAQRPARQASPGYHLPWP